jgi:hypothetical protein
MKKVLILGAAGRDFHNFNVVFRNNPAYRVVAFTAAQIPDIAGRKYPAELAGALYPGGIPIAEEANLERIIRESEVDVVVFAYSDVSYPTLMHLASRSVAAGADFWLLGTERTQIKSRDAGHLGLRGSHRMRQEPGLAAGCGRVAATGVDAGGDSTSDAVWRSGGTKCAALRHHSRSGHRALHD